MINDFNKRKVLLITNIPTPYRLPLFNVLNNEFAKIGVIYKVIFGGLGYSRRKWKIDMAECQFDYEVLRTMRIKLPMNEKTIFTYTGLLNIINNETPDIIIVSGFSLATLKLWLRSFFITTSYIIWSGSIVNKSRSESLIRRIQRKIIIRRASGFIAYGTKAKEYLISLGAEEGKIHIGINTTDIEYLRTQTARIRTTLKNRDREKHLLYIGHFTKGKCLDKLLHIVKNILRKRNDFILELVGSGPELENLQFLAEKLDIINFIKFEGYQQKEKIPEYLARADCFLFPSEYDIWGMVLVEAMSVGLPCIASIHAGATCELINDGKTGFIVDFADIEKATDKINWIIENKKKADEIGKNASRFIEEYGSLEISANGFIRAIQSL